MALKIPIDVMINVDINFSKPKDFPFCDESQLGGSKGL